MSLDDAAVETVRQRVAARELELVELALELSNLTDLAGHEREIAERVAAWWRVHGIDAVVQPLSDTSANVIARLPDAGAATPVLTLNAHLDTEGGMPEGDTERRRRLRGAWRENRLLIGKGLVNDKIHVAAQMIAGATLLELPATVARGLLVVGVAQETGAPVPGSAPGRGDDPLSPPHTGEGEGARALLEAGARSQLALIGEPNGFTISGAQAGVLRLRIDVGGQMPYTPFIRRGEAGTANPNPYERAGRIVVALTEWAQELEDRERLAFWGGTVIPKAQVQGIRSWGHPYTEEEDTCHIFFDVRTPPGGRHKELVQQIETVIGAIVEDHELVVYEEQAGYVAAGATRLIDAVAVAHERVFGEPPAPPPAEQVSMWHDTNTYLAAGIPAVSYGIRPLAEPYTIERRRAVRIEDAVGLAIVYALTALQLCGRQ